MSRIGKQPIPIPKGIKVQIKGQEINVQGPKGKQALTHHDDVTVKQDGDNIIVERKREDRHGHSLQGLTRTLVANMITGVAEGFSKTLEIVGVGYRAEVKGKTLVLSVGHSHPVEMPLPDGVEAQVDKNTKIVLTSYDKQRLGQFAAEVRAMRPPEPYKGKGIKYAGEIIRRKVGKATG